MEPTGFYSMEGRLDCGSPLEIVTNMMNRTIFYPGADNVPDYVQWCANNLAQHGVSQMRDFKASTDPDEAAMQYLNDIGPLSDGRFITEQEAQQLMAR